MHIKFSPIIILTTVDSRRYEFQTKNDDDDDNERHYYWRLMTVDDDDLGVIFNYFSKSVNDVATDHVSG